MPSRQQTIVGARAPTNITVLCSFLGLVNYYGRLYPLSSYSAASVESPAVQGSLLELDPSLPEGLPGDQGDLGFSSSTCSLYDSWLSLTLVANASTYGEGAVISQTYQDGTECPLPIRLAHSNRVRRTMRSWNIGIGVWSQTLPPVLVWAKVHLIHRP